MADADIGSHHKSQNGDSEVRHDLAMVPEFRLDQRGNNLPHFAKP
jgi:hypothetical protein